MPSMMTSTQPSLVQKNSTAKRSPVKLGVNIDHVATIRNARGGNYPCPIRAAEVAERYGADGITAHLREDRRHITDSDIRSLRGRVQTRLNLEMANTAEMVQLALWVRPDMVTLVPERRQEITTEGGLDVVRFGDALKETVQRLQEVGIEASLFVDPDTAQLEASKATGATFVELHTGRYCEAFEQGQGIEAELTALMQASHSAHALGLGLNAGHGLHTGNVRPILDLPHLVELNIGHSIIADAVFMGLGEAVQQMKQILSFAE
jgi:pyridoxine 5-phosphate synthase